MSRAHSAIRRSVLAGLVAIAAVAACDDLQGPEIDAPPAPLPFVAAFDAATQVTGVVVTVTGARIDPPLVFNFPVVNDTARGTMVLPVGNARTLVAQGFDSAGVEIYRGEVTINVVAGTNPAVTLVMAPRLGSQPIVVRVGSTTVTVTPGTLSLAPGDTARLTVAVTDQDGVAIAGVTPVFASSNPAFATVSATGLVTARLNGATAVTVTARGVAARIPVTVATPTLRSP